MASPFESVEHERFAHPPLKAMFGQVRFPAVLKVADPGSLGAFQEALRDRFPEFAQEEQVTFVVGPEGAQAPVNARRYRFSTTDGTWSVVLAPDMLTVEAGADQYTSYDRFREHFIAVWSAALEHIAPSRVLHQGLRYIDHIERDLRGADWGRLVRPELLGSLASEELAGGLLHAVTDMRLERPHGLLFFKHGVAQAGPTNALGYLFDFDYFTQEATVDIDPEQLGERFDRFHDELYALFRWCITEEAVEEFRGAGR